jgi:replicative DNA helicase
MTGVYEFDAGFQTKLAALSSRDTGFLRQTSGLIKPEHFESKGEALLVAVSIDFFDRYKTVPHGRSEWVEVLRDAKVKFKLSEDNFKEMVSAFKATSKATITGRKYAIDKCSEFAKNQAVQTAMLEAADLVEKGMIEESQKVLEKAFAVGASEEYELVDYWNDIERRSEYRKAIASGAIKPNGVKTGIPQFDNLLYHKGFGRKELTALLGGAKKGKSMGLGEFAVRCAMQGYNVFYASLEVGLNIITDRLDANLSSTEMDTIQDHINAVDSKVRMASAGPGKERGILKLAEFASGSLSPKMLRRILEREKSDGNEFDLIVIDYADIMAPDIHMNSEIENSKQVWLGLRAIAFDEDAAVLTATQTNRDGFKATVSKSEDVAEDFNKIRIADLVISVNRTEEETDNGEARLYWAAVRNGASNFTMKVTQNLAKGQFLNSILEIT